MKKENIFDLYAAQHKDEPAHSDERMPGEVKPEDVEKLPEVPPQDPEPKQEPPQDPEPKQEPPQDPEPKQEGGNGNAI